MYMNELREIQVEFLDYLLNQNYEVAAHIVEDDRIDITTRLNIYENAYRLRLKGTIETDHEVLGKYLGDELFERMAEGYIKYQPSSYSSLRHFCSALPAYLKNTPPFSEHPILSELAGFEQHLLFAFDAAECKRCDLHDLQIIAAEKWPDMKLRFHPSMQIFHADWNSVESWQAIRSEKVPPTAAQQKNSYWILWRSIERITEFRSLATDEHAMISAFLKGLSFSEICEELLEWHKAENVSIAAVNYLKDWINKGLVRQFVVN